jgi:3,4-dihydroxy 2-butanone 4-phosphate synthase/GTP cyclohydrolase II
LAGVEPVGVICEILRDDGTMMRADELVEFSARHGLPVLFIADLVRFRLGRETLVAKAAESRLETEFGPFMVAVYEEGLTGQGHLALTLGSVDDGAPVLVRVHSECVTGDALGATACSCRRDLAAAMAAIQREGRGVLLYMQPEHRTAGLIRQIRAYADGASAAGGPEPHPELRPDLRDIGAGAAILADLGVRRLRLLTNHPRPYPGLEGYGLTVEEFVPLPPAADTAPVAPRQKGVL